MTRVKICGVTSVEDAVSCAMAGADAVGMLVNVKVSPRRITVEKAREITRRLPPFITPVIVMMPSSHEEVIDAALRIRPGAIQLHGNESPETLLRIRQALPGIRLIKTIHVGEGAEVERSLSYKGSADAILLDTASPAKGGSGATHDWSISGEIVSALSMPVILAGGLSPSNVGNAIRSVRPFAVDVSSGVEMKGQKSFIKDIDLVRDFIIGAREA
ncbi:N-(5'-phosphoribosyl)anthranilate isomerase [Methanocella sp. CWC-04]|uniref:N-(5'-phosphoribosyl)anthranilate isomerase n=1 Tax=Methanooceanicella nereidis TaxID=2052831 RepID=A0AAP2REY7_9EURY|nr:phosphoribosylanthranilate isomerase [Methanocella sp. CWC-04]MCD1296341.1 N-(5'-phosphoribosyl)anthranilate isomerase [Methanocella sp. CWC-04]